ncbi:hypothetical protein [Pontibacter sp. H249]|uniref:hypothetical protein n=1 Tax=Pontibacter sp. H249 TaxID=3133420 RepID=UPI0030BEBD57
MESTLQQTQQLPQHQVEMVDSLTALFRERLLEEIGKRRRPAMSLEEALVLVDIEKKDIELAKCRHIPSKAREEHFDLLVKVGMGYVDCQSMAVSYD